MKVTVKEEIKGFSGKLSFGATASAGTHSAVFYSALQRAPVQRAPVQKAPKFQPRVFFSFSLFLFVKKTYFAISLFPSRHLAISPSRYLA